MAKSGDIFGCHSWEAHGATRRIPRSPGVPLYILQCTRRTGSSPQRMLQNHDVSSAKVEALQPFPTTLFLLLFPLSNALLLSDSDGKMTASNQNASWASRNLLCSQSVVGEFLSNKFS